MRLSTRTVLGLILSAGFFQAASVSAQDHYYDQYDEPGSRRLGIFKRPQGLLHLFPLPEDRIDCVRRWSYEDYQIRGQLPTGVRQREFKGRMWPVQPRPVGPKPHIIHRYHDAHYWPYPYKQWDKASVDALIETQQINGWKEATTLFDYHFEPDSNELTGSGVQHVRWILTDAPSRYRTFFVQTSANPGANEKRTESVREVAARLMAGGDEIPPIELRNTIPSGRPADEINAIRDSELLSQPIPRIQYIGGNSFDQ